MIFTYHLPSIPDTTDHRLITQYGGDVRKHVYGAWEHLLRMIANFQEGQIALALRMLFGPGQETQRQQRVRLQLAVRIGDGVGGDTVQQLIDAGPLAEFYEFEPQSKPVGPCPLAHDYTCVCEVVRQEEGIEPLVSKLDNDRVPALYYALYPFEPQPDNDYLTVDRLLSKMKEPSAVEFLVCPVDHVADLAAHYGYITHLASVNAYGDDFDGDGIGAQPWSDDHSLTQVVNHARKKDPIADEILR